MLYKAIQPLIKMMTGARKITALLCRPRGMNDSGNMLVVVIILISIISVSSMTALGTLRREVKKVTEDYCELVAFYTAESGIELAKRDLFTSGSIDFSGDCSPRSLEFAYGSVYFPENAGRTISCRVVAYVHPNSVYLESKATVLKKPDAEGRSQDVAERTSKKLLRIISSSRTLSVVWQVCD